MKKTIIIILVSIVVVAGATLISIESYTACGCGGCVGQSPIYMVTFKPREVIEKDRETKSSNICKVVGCGVCVKYFYPKFLK